MNEIAPYIQSHPVAILGTVDSDGRPHGAAVYMAVVADELYFITKTDTQKFKNIAHNSHVSVTIADPDENSSLQATGKVRVVHDALTIEMVTRAMTRIYAKSVDWLPPIAKLRAGSYQVVHIKLGYTRLAHFKGKHAGSQDIFKKE